MTPAQALVELDEVLEAAKVRALEIEAELESFRAQVQALTETLATERAIHAETANDLAKCIAFLKDMRDADGGLMDCECGEMLEELGIYEDDME